MASDNTPQAVIGDVTDALQSALDLLEAIEGDRKSRWLLDPTMDKLREALAARRAPVAAQSPIYAIPCRQQPNTPEQYRTSCTSDCQCVGRAPVALGEVPFQSRVQPWMQACFGPVISADTKERNHRFFEESTELVQACGMTASEAHQLVDYVFGRPVGEKVQEAGGVMVTLAALCLAQRIDMHEAGEIELQRIWGKVEQIRAKQAAKPAHSPLPESATPPAQGDAKDAELATICREFVEKQDIHCVDTIYQTDRVSENALAFIEGVCGIVGYKCLEEDAAILATSSKGVEP